MFCSVLVKQSRDQNQLLIYFSLIKKKGLSLSNPYPKNNCKSNLTLKGYDSNNGTSKSVYIGVAGRTRIVL